MTEPSNSGHPLRLFPRRPAGSRTIRAVSASELDPHDGPGLVDIADPVAAATRTAGVADDVCQSCDAPGSWTLSKRHRFSPFGGVTLITLAFWAVLLGWLTGFSLLPGAVFALLGVILIAARRTALECQVCGFVRSRN